MTEFIGPYRVVRKLGAGGMGEVFLADDPRLGRKVALKRPYDDWIKSPESADRLRREARAAAQLSHPNIAGIHDVLDFEGRPHIVMEFVDGQNLAETVRSGPLAPRQVLDIGLQLTEALIEAHARGVIHRDLKPANVILMKSGRIKVLDFGLAKILGSEVSASEAVTEPGRVFGTPGYMAPEQMLGHVDRRTDIYSAGILLFELLTGKAPFAESDPIGRTLAALSQRDGPRADIANPSVPSAMGEVVARALSRDPGDRYQSADEMRLALVQAQASLSELPTDLSGVLIGDAALAMRSGDQPTAPLSPRIPVPLAPPAVTPAFTPRPATPRPATPAVPTPAQPSLETPLATPSAAPTVVRRRMPIARLVLLGVAAIAAIVVVARPWIWSTPVPVVSGSPIVAVLPFTTVNLNEDAAEPLALGFTDSLITDLATNPSLTVVRRNDLRELNGTRDAASVARLLGANLIVDAQLQRVGNSLRINVSLSRTDGKPPFWDAKFEGTTDRAFDLQRQVADGVIAAGGFVAADRASTAPRSSDLAALVSYGQGRNALDRPDIAGNLDKAIERLTAAIVRDPAFALAHAALGEAALLKYRETKEEHWVSDALDTAEKAVSLDPQLADALVARAAIFRQMGRGVDAAADLGRAIALQRTHDNAHEQLGEALIVQGEIERGLSELREAVKLRPIAHHFDRLGVALLRLGRSADAVAPLQRVTELQPDNAQAFHRLGTAYQLQNDYPRALTYYNDAIKIRGLSETYGNMGVIQFDQGDYSAAASSFQEAIKIKGNEPQNHRNLGDAYQHLGQTKDALAEWNMSISQLDAALKVNPSSAPLLGQLAVCLAKVGRFADAHRRADAAVALAPKDPDVLYRRAVVLALDIKHASATEVLDALELALDHHYSVDRARKDDDLSSVRDLSQFEAVLRKKRN